jgi:hypothetical protein
MKSEDIIRLKLTTRKGTRMESVAAKKLEKISKTMTTCKRICYLKMSK